MIRTLIFYLMVLSFFGMGVCDLRDGEWRMGVVGLLLGVIQLLVFWR